MFWSIKTKRQHLIVCAVVGLLALSCQEKPTQTFLYNIDSLVSAQVDILKKSGARLQKNAFVNGVAADTIISDSSIWTKELTIFQELHDINKPVNRSNYLVDDGLFDPSSNLTVKAFSAKTDLPVKYIRVFYQESVQRPRKIEALYDNKNSLYKSGRLLTMEFVTLRNQVLLTSYTIEGGQKMMLGDSVMFTVKGKIILD